MAAHPRTHKLLSLLIVGALLIFLWRAFPAIARFMALAALELRYFWWAILGIFFIVYFFWYARRQRKE